MSRRACTLAAFLLTAVPLTAVPLPAQAQMALEIRVQFHNEADADAIIAWRIADTGATVAVPQATANQTTEHVEYWQPWPNVPTQRHVLTVTLPGRACQTTLELKMTYATPGLPGTNSFGCAFVETSGTRLSCVPQAQATLAETSTTGGSCAASLRFGG